LEQLISLNKTRADFLAKFEELVESYNTGSRNIEELFRELLALSRTLTDEHKRHVRENLSEAELTVFGILLNRVAFLLSHSMRIQRIVGAFPHSNAAVLLVAARLWRIAGMRWGSKKMETTLPQR
jgi:hypothetical protein